MSKALHFLSKDVDVTFGSLGYAGFALPSDRLQVSDCLGGIRPRSRTGTFLSLGLPESSTVDSPFVLVAVLLAGEASICMAFATRMAAEQLLLGPAMHLVDFTLVTKQTTGVCEALQLRACWVTTAPWTFMFVVVLAMNTLVLYSKDCVDSLSLTSIRISYQTPVPHTLA